MATRIVEGSSVEVIICIDFEWTCEADDIPEEERKVRADQGEIIEFAFVVYDVEAKQVTCRGQHYCRPQRTPITAFCSKLTGITEEMLDSAGTLQDALLAFEEALALVRAEDRACCTVAHGSCDLELTLPANCKALGLTVPSLLRKYVDLREAAQEYVTSDGREGLWMGSLRQICAALDVEMVGEEHCGVDDANMVLLATQALLQRNATLREVNLDLEFEAFMAAPSQSLCLDSFPFVTTGGELRPWLEDVFSSFAPTFALLAVFGSNGRPAGRAILEFEKAEHAQEALVTFGNGRCFVCRGKERHVLLRPLRWTETELRSGASLGSCCKPQVTRGSGAWPWPAIVPFPMTADDLEVLKRSGSEDPTREETNVRGTIVTWKEDKNFGFIRCGRYEVFAHQNQVKGVKPREGLLVKLDIKLAKNGKYQAHNVQKAR